ncbi:MAG TPA: hypothetical protein VFU73_00940 [Actinocrinis sp.]|nr:hypothetical protein [Actinocrinis sp.]
MTACTVTTLGPAAVLAAAERIGGRVRRTPLLRTARPAGHIAGRARRIPLLTIGAQPGVLLKPEHFQRSSSSTARARAAAAPSEVVDVAVRTSARGAVR